MLSRLSPGSSAFQSGCFARLFWRRAANLRGLPAEASLLGGDYVAPTPIVPYPTLGKDSTE
jgi:hypothetical protein